MPMETANLTSGSTVGASSTNLTHLEEVLSLKWNAVLISTETVNSVPTINAWKAILVAVPIA